MVTTQKQKKVQIDNPKFNMKKGGSFPFNQNAGRDFSFQNQKDPNFVTFS